MNKKVFEKLPIANERNLTEFVYKDKGKYYLVQRRGTRWSEPSEIVKLIRVKND